MYALVDASGMYASCEKVFAPDLRNKPVVVLSNNDGCIVAVCPIAKRLGVPKFEPYFKVKPMLDSLGVIARSSNYELYADLSQRMMDTCARFAPEQYVYSIDENFLGYGSYTPACGWFDHGMAIRRTVWKESRIPVGVGFAPTLTLAKAANHASKKIHGYKGVAVIDTERERQHILSNMAPTDVWGIGRKIGKRLASLGIDTALALANASPDKMREQFSVLVESTVYELNGQPRLAWDDVRSPKKQIFSTRSFGQRVTNLAELRQSLVKHCCIVAEKLRAQDTLAKSITVFAQNSIHDNVEFYRRSATHRFYFPTSDSCVLSAATSKLTGNIFRPDVEFYKSGVGLVEIVDARPTQQDMFAVSNDKPQLMQELDTINARFGKDTLFIAAKGADEKFAMRRQLLSKRSTTRLNELPVFFCE